MASPGTLLCIHRDPAQLSPLQEHGYNLMSATNGNEGLRLFMAQPVDAIVLEYHLGLLNGGFVAAQIKKVRPGVPILMLIDHLVVPDGALQCVDMVVAKADGDDFLLSAVRHVLGSKPKNIVDVPSPSPHGSSNHDAPFSSEEWQSILNGSVRISAPSEARPGRRTS